MHRIQLIVKSRVRRITITDFKMSFLSDLGSVRSVEYVSVDVSFPLIREREWRSAVCFCVATSCSAANSFSFEIHNNLCLIQGGKKSSVKFCERFFCDACGVFDLGGSS